MEIQRIIKLQKIDCLSGNYKNKSFMEKFTKEEKEEIRKKITQEGERMETIKKEGYLGIMPSGHIVDRRIYPDAIPMQENKMLGIPKPSEF